MTAARIETYVRSEAGRTEITAKATGLSRPARNLLLVIDASRSGSEWVRRILGATGDDLQQLIAMHLVEPSDGAVVKPAAASMTIEEAVQKWQYDALYLLLTQEARARFGLLKGFRLVLEIEGSANLQDLQKIALKFADGIRKSHGEDPAARFRKQLGASE